MSSVASVLSDLVKAAAVAAGHGDSPIPVEPAVPTNDPRFGDYQSNFAFRLGKSLRTNPRQVAMDMVSKLPEHPMVASAEVAGPGFINFRLSDAWIGEELVRRTADKDFGGSRPGEGRTVVIDYSSPNIAKRMHVGHLRSTLIGNAMARMYGYLGWKVVADNHIGDWGTQFGKLIVAWHNWRNDAAYKDDPIGELQRLYKKFGVVAADQPELVDQARAETAKLQEGDPENRALWEEFVEVSMKEFNGVYERLGVHFDVVLGESFYRDGLVELVDGLLEQGLAIHSEGAVVVPFDASEGKGLGKSPLLVRKRDGASLYGTTDLATVKYRMETWNPERVIILTDVRQQLHFRQVFAAAKKMGFETDFRHIWFGMLRFADGSIAATRSQGQSLNLVDVLDEAVAHARKVVDGKSGHLDEAERAAIAEAVGTGAVRYTDLAQNPQSDIIFDWDKMLSMQGNTAPYLMYAHARAHSILRKGGVEGYEPVSIQPEHEAERALAVHLLKFPEVITLAANTGRPNLLADTLYELASLFARFYTECPVLKEGVSDEVRASRLGLVSAAAKGLSLGLTLLGLTPLERM